MIDNLIDDLMELINVDDTFFREIVKWNFFK